MDTSSFNDDDMIDFTEFTPEQALNFFPEQKNTPNVHLNSTNINTFNHSFYSEKKEPLPENIIDLTKDFHFQNLLEKVGSQKRIVIKKEPDAQNTFNEKLNSLYISFYTELNNLENQEIFNLFNHLSILLNKKFELKSKSYQGQYQKEILIPFHSAYYERFLDAAYKPTEKIKYTFEQARSFTYHLIEIKTQTDSVVFLTANGKDNILYVFTFKNRGYSIIDFIKPFIQFPEAQDAFFMENLENISYAS